MSVVAVVTFVAAYILIATERVPKMVTALAGAGVVLAFGVASSEDAFYSHDTGVDWDVIFLLLGMMIIVGILRQTGVFEYVAIWAAKRAKGSAFRVMVLLVLITAVASALLDNVTTVLLIAPVTLLVCERLGVSPVPFLIAEVLAFQHRRRSHLDRRPTEHHHRQPIRADLQRLPDAHDSNIGAGHRRLGRHVAAAISRLLPGRSRQSRRCDGAQRAGKRSRTLGC